jgi:hypothetical protein
MAALIIFTVLFVAAPLVLMVVMRRSGGPRGGHAEHAEENPELLRRPLRSRYPL